MYKKNQTEVVTNNGLDYYPSTIYESKILKLETKQILK